MRDLAYLIDPFSENGYHEVINMSYLYLISKSYKQVIYVCSPSSFKNSMSKLSKQGLGIGNVENIEISIPKYKQRKYWGGINYCRSWFRGAYIGIKYYMSTPKGADVFFNNNILGGLNTINFLSKIKRNRLFIMCHSEINILEKENIGYGEMITRLLLRAFLRGNISKYLCYFVLGDNIRKNLLAHTAKRNWNKIQSLDHPYFRNQCKVSNVIVPGERGRLKIGIPSLINKNRGLDFLIQLLNDSRAERGYDIYAIGRVISETYNMNDTPLILLNNSMELLPSDIYTAYTKTMDAMVFFVDDNRFGASGGVLEAIWEEKIILSLKNDYILYIFKKFGAMGYVFDNVKDMADFLNEHMDELESRKQYFHDNLKKAKHYLYPENMLVEFNRLIK